MKEVESSTSSSDVAVTERGRPPAPLHRRPELLAILKDAGVLRVSEADDTILGLDEPEGEKEG
jgi:hypothetical protein